MAALTFRVNIINQDILAVTHGVVCQQVNCRGAFGAGLALATRRKFPSVADAFFKKRDWKLGDALFVEVASDHFHALLAGQDRYGRGERFTDYAALEAALRKAQQFADPLRIPMFVPFGIGCGLAGGDWAIVSEILERICPKAYVCRKD